MAKERDQTKAEEIANTITHSVGLGLSIAALVLLAVYSAMRGGAIEVTSLVIFGSSLILVYLASVFYHSFRPGPIKNCFLTLDQSAVFILIAGTYTPIFLLGLRGAWGWSMFGVTWGIAVTGILLKITFTAFFDKIAVAIYLVLGWNIMIAFKPMMERFPDGLFLWILLGGLSYTVGLIFYALRDMKFHHTIWHLFVLGGSICHFFGMFFYLTEKTNL